jgi:serine/threonine protein kinase
MTTEPGRLTPVAVGDVLAGKYEVERVLGFGGMGVVVAAKHLTLGERVAIKFLLPQAMKKAEVKQRFLREARAAVRIKSEHVARVFDVGTLEDGAPYMVMELLEGADLSALLKTRGATSVDVAVDYVLQACEAIAEAHSLGIIHRDLKPANLFVSKRADGSAVVKVIDFGISKVAEAEGEVEMTKTDVMMGSPVYMAPEQMISARDVDVRADVWSLGVILFYLIMGRQPFLGNSVTQLYASIIDGPPRLCETRRDVPPALEAAVMKCLMAQPRERWSNVAEFALAIAEFGPPTARVSADRVSRTLGVTTSSNDAVRRSAPGAASASTPALATSDTPGPSSAPSTAPLSATVPVANALGPNPGDSTGSRSGGGRPGLSPEVAPPSNTDGSWGGTQGPFQRSRSRTWLIAIAAVAVLGAAGGAVLMLAGGGSTSEVPVKPDASPGSSIPASPSTTTTVSPVSPVSPAPSDGPAAPPTASATAAPIASATATAHATTTATAGKPATTSRGPGTPRPTPTKPKTDLFSDPH